jgi:chromosome segregation ATPase
LSQINGVSARVKQAITDLELQVEGLKERLISTALANNNLTNRIEKLVKKQAETEKELRIIKASSPLPRSTPAPEVFDIYLSPPSKLNGPRT